jgi:integrase
MKARISKRTVDALPADGPKARWLADDAIPGFRVRGRNGRRVYMLKYPTGVSGRARWVTIGEHGKPWRPDPNTGEGRSLTADLARREAERLRGLVVDGQDPARDRDVARRVPTLEDFVVRYKRDYSAVHHKESTAAMDAYMIKLKILPRWGRYRLDRIDAAEISEWLAPMAKKQPAYGNRIIGVLSRVFSAAIRWKVLKGENPCSGVRRFQAPERDRLLSPDELQRLGAVLVSKDSGTTRFSVAGILLLMFTGARRGEIASLRWEQIDNAERVTVGDVEGLAVRQDGKTGKRYIFFPPTALAVLRQLAPTLEDRINAWVLPARRGAKGHMGGIALSQAFLRCARKAGIENTHLHDLRHLFVSRAVAGGRSLPDAGKLAGHASAKMTERYTHLAADALLPLAERTADQIFITLGRPALQAPGAQPDEEKSA